MDALVALCDASVQWRSAMTVPGGAAYHGPGGVLTWLRDLDDAWGNDLRVELEVLYDLGDYTLAFATMRGQGRESGAATTMPIAQVFRWRRGLIVSYRSYTDRQEALNDLAVSPDALEPIRP